MRSQPAANGVPFGGEPVTIDTPRIDVKVYLDGAATVVLDDFVPVFHDWIKHHRLDETLIDVAHYGHVDHGPGVLLIGHEAHYAMDLLDDRLGLLYSRKRGDVEPDLASRFRQGIRRALQAARQLEVEPTLQAKVRFRGNELWLRVRDRLQAPNRDATWDAVRPAVESVAEAAFGAGATIEREPDHKAVFGVRIRSGAAVTTEELLARLAG